MTKTANDHLATARTIRDRILSGAENRPTIQAWADVARECAKALSKFYAENPGVHGRRHQAWLSNLDRLDWAARAQVETLARGV